MNLSLTFLVQASYVSVSLVIVINDDRRMAKIKHGDITIQHAFHHRPGGEPFIKRISSLNLEIDSMKSVGEVVNYFDQVQSSDHFELS